MFRAGIQRLDPASPATTGRVQRAGHQVQALRRGLLGGEVTAGAHVNDRPRRAGDSDRVGAEDTPDLDVVVQERDELGQALRNRLMIAGYVLPDLSPNSPVAPRPARR